VEHIHTNDISTSNEGNNQAKSSKTALTFIFITILIDVIGIGLVMPVMPQLIAKLTGGDLADSALYGGLLMVCFAGMQFLFAPVMGELSDRFGRRPILMISLFVLSIDYFFHAFAPTIGWLIVTRILAGITGASFTVASSYIADVSTPENKAKNFGVIGAAFGLGFILGPALGGIGADWGVEMPFIIAAGLAFLNFLFGYFFVPESLAVSKRRKINYRNMIPGVSLIQLGKYKTLLGLVIAFFLVNLAGQVMPNVWSFFTLEKFKWDTTDVGISFAVVGALVVIVQVFLIGWFVKKLGSKRVILLGFLFWTIGMIGFALAINEVILYLALIPYCLGGIAGPSIQGLLSNSVSEKEQGNLNGALMQAVSITAVAAPLIYNTLFFNFSKADATVYFPGAPYLAAAVIILISCVVAFISLRNFKDTDLAVVKEELQPATEPIQVH